MQIIQCASYSETQFIGTKSGIMGQLISLLSKAGNAMFIDARSLEYRYIPLPQGDIKILITDSKVVSSFAAAEYDQRKEECAECVTRLNQKKPGNALRDYTASDIRESLGFIPEMYRKRCLHVVEENQRVLDAEEALKKKDITALGKIMNRSHDSLRDFFEVSCPEVDWLVKRAWETEGVFGSRMTGIGFGGCTITLIKESSLEDYKKRLDDYERIFGFRANTFICEPSDGAQILYSIHS